MIGECLQVLLIEDDDDHAEIVFRSMEQHRVANQIHRVTDGEAALDYLFRRGAFSDPKVSPRPSLVLLDLRLPKVDGLEVLRQVKESRELRAIPVVILTTSSAGADLDKAYQNYANSYIVKPFDFAQFNQVIDTLGYYWLAWNRSPFGENCER